MWRVWALLLVSAVLGAEEFLQGDDAEGLERHWDDLRVLTRCPACGGGLRLIAALTDPASIRRYLHGGGLPTQPPPRNPPRSPPQQQWDFAA